MVKRYNPHSEIDASAWIVEAPGGTVVLACDYDLLAAELSGYKESHDKYCPGAARIAALEAELADHKANARSADALEEQFERKDTRIAALEAQNEGLNTGLIQLEEVVRQQKQEIAFQKDLLSKYHAQNRGKTFVTDDERGGHIAKLEAALRGLLINSRDVPAAPDSNLGKARACLTFETNSTWDDCAAVSGYSRAPMALKACPFCGGGETLSEPASRHWTGARSVILSWRVRHWCGHANHAPFLTVSGKDQAEAEGRWNARFHVNTEGQS